MPLSPDARRLLETIFTPRLPPFDALPLRLGHEASTALLADDPPPVHAVDGFAVPPDPARGTPLLAVRRYRPRPPGPAPDAAIVWLHGGGWVSGTLDGFDTFGRALAAASGRQVLMVDYRLAPEAPYPAAVHDACAAFDAIVARAAALGLDPERIAAGGDSAGGHLAITMSRWLAAAGRPGPSALLLVYPVTDARMVSDSYGTYAEGHYLTAALMAWFWQQFVPLGTRVDDRPLSDEHPDLSPLLADDLGALPPTLVATAECDVLHDEGVAFARAAAAAGVDAEHVEFPGMIHGFLRCRAALAEARALPGRLSDWLAARGV